MHQESKKYFDAINGILNHQIEFSKAIAEIYRPISGRVSDPDSIISEGNPEGIAACEEYESIVRDQLETLQPELEMIETRVIRPADELLEIIKVIRKTTAKRQHKQLDYDRHKASLQKIKDKKEKSLKDEKNMYKAEAEFEQATQEFEYFNDLLKDELPKLFRLEREFIRPLFQSFYYMQLNVFYTLHEKMQSINIGYFDLALGIEEAFESKRGLIKDQAEQLTITRFKTTGGKHRPPASKYGTGRLAIANKPHSTAGASASTSSHSNTLAIENGSSTSDPRRRTHDFSEPSPPPPYSSGLKPPSTSTAIARANSTGSSWGAAAKAKGAAPPPPKPKPKRLSAMPTAIPQVETATALYDYEAQAEGDLSFSVGEVIRVVKRGATAEEWWTGDIGGREGQFPGTYFTRYSSAQDIISCITKSVKIYD